MQNIKVCPYCGSREFMAHIKRGCLVECNGIDENGKPTFKVFKEGAKNRYELEILRCSSCNHDLTEDDLIGGVPCKNCGKLFPPSSLDENGNCEVCAMLLANPQLQNASQDDLLRLLARAMKGMKADTSIVEQKQEQAAQIEMELNEENNSIGEMPSAADAILNGGTPSDVIQPKPRRKRTVKRVVDQPAEVSEDVVDIVENVPDTVPEQQLSFDEIPFQEQQEQQEQAVAVDEIANSQEAPFPDIPESSSFPTQSIEQPAEVPTIQVGSGFKMFDGGNDEEPF